LRGFTGASLALPGSCSNSRRPSSPSWVISAACLHPLNDFTFVVFTYPADSSFFRWFSRLCGTIFYADGHSANRDSGHHLSDGSFP
jgi:hypothetical protein